MTRISGVSWNIVWESNKSGIYGTVPVLFIGRKAWVMNKRAAGRVKDLAVPPALGE
jgi:hypothetical protein